MNESCAGVFFLENQMCASNKIEYFEMKSASIISLTTYQSHIQSH
jgi:hypothetical protein